MRKEQIISKGIYTGAQYPELVSVKQYIIFRKDGEKCLLLRFSNDRNEAVNAVHFKLKQFDVKGNELSSDVHFYDGINVGAGRTFALERELHIDEDCVDFTLEVESARYGEYEYTLKNGQLIAAYNGQSEEPPFDKEKMRRKFKGENQNIIGKTLHAPKMILFSMFAALLIIAAFSYAQLRYFMSTEETFTLENVEYAFTTDNRESGPITIIAYMGKAGNVIVPTEIEGHKVESIAEGAFKGTRLVSVFIEGDLLIGDSVFENCKYLKSVEMPNVTYLGKSIFEDCQSLESVILGNVTYIGDNVFTDCESIEKIDLPSTLTAIGQNAFANCKSLKEIVIPDSVKEIGKGILTDCKNIESIKLPFIGVGINNPDKLAYLYGNTKISDATKKLKSITVTKMTVVVKDAFNGCSAVQTISLPDNISQIGDNAFKGCAALKDFSIPSSVKTIGAYAFNGCASLKEVNIPFSVAEINVGVFSGCKSLVSISLPTSILHIRSEAFMNCETLSSVIIPVNVQTIEKGAFANCTNIKDMTLSFIGTTVNEPYTLEDLFGTTNIRLENIRVRGAKVLAPNTFSGFGHLTSVTIGGMIDKIEEYCFADAHNLQSVEIPESVKSIGEGAFANCASLESINLPDGITIINDMTFMNCESLSELIIPDGVTSVGESAFAGCKSLTGTEWIERMSYIGNNAFEGCERIETVSLDSSITLLPNAIFKNCVNLKEITLPSDTIGIGEEAFYGCESLGSIDIPAGVTYVGAGAFALCEQLLEIDIPLGTVEIGAKAFEGCTGITAINIPLSVEIIGDGVVKDCSSLKELTIPFLGIMSANEGTIKHVCGDSIPDSLEKVTLTNEDYISDEAFYECINIKEIILNDGIQGIGSYAFYGSGIETLEIPSTVTSVKEYAFASTPITKLEIPSGVTVLGNGIFDRCQMEEISVPFIGRNSERVEAAKYLFDGYTVPETLKKVVITGAYTIEDHAFYDCNYIEEIVIEGNISEIGERAFADCDSLISISLPDTLEKIGLNILQYCNSITEVTVPYVGLERNDSNSFAYLFSEYSWNMPQSLRSITITNEATIKPRAFEGCQNVEKIVYEKDLESIGDYAFLGCNRLLSFDLPNTLKTIGDQAFSSCYSLSSVVIPSGMESIGRGTFIWCYNLLEVYNYSDIEDYAVWDSSLRNYCVAYRTDDTPISKAEINNLEFILGDDGNWYFNKCTSKLESVVFPASFTFEDGEITEYSIPRYSFYQNKDITSVTVTNAITYIGSDAFWGCDNLREVYNLSDMNIQRGSYDYGQIGYYAYIIHTSNEEEPLTEVKINDIVFLKSGEHWFLKSYEGDGTKLVLDEFEYEGKIVSSFEVLWRALKYDSPVEELIIGNAVKKLEREAFYNMGSLKKVSFETNTSITTIPDNCFAYSYNLSQVILPSSLTSIEYGAFRECSMLIEVYNLSDMELTIGSNDNGHVAKYAFVVHKSMNEEPLKEVKIGNFTYLNSGDLWMLKKYSGNDNVLTLGEFEYNGKKITSYTIAGRAFSYCSSLKELKIENAVKSIASYAFEDCYNLEKVSFENNTQIKVIPSYAFAWCNRLKTVILPASLEAIESDAFCGCNTLLEVYNPSELELILGSTDHGQVARYAVVIHTSLDEAPLESVTIDGFEFFTDKNTVWVLVKYTGNNETIDFKGIKYDGKSVENIIVLSYAFQNSTSVKKVVFGNEVKDIRNNAFSNNYTLEYVSFKDCSNIKFIPENAFSWCDNLNTVVISQYITDIGYDAFWECSSIYNVCNLGHLPITQGSTDYGRIGEYAQNICYSEEDIVEFKTLNENGIKFMFKRVQGNWEMYETNITISYIETLILPELVIDGEVTDYAISVDLPNCSNLVVPESVKSIRNAKSMSIYRLMYFGEGKVRDLFGYSIFRTDFCYVECVHKDGEWTYGQNGTIITNYDVTMAKRDPTCTLVGADVYTCNRCDEKWEENIIELRSHVVDPTTNKCENCDTQFAPGVTSEYWEITNDITYPFDLNDNGSIKSTNTVEGTVAEMVLVAKTSFSVYFKGDISNETDCGRGMLSFMIAGNLSGCGYTNEYPTNTHNLRVNEGDTVTITFTKGSSQDGKDCFTLSNFIYADE